ncbi:TPA: hypothetical protein ACJLYR_001857, partial [Neisseria meningitidis]
EEGAHGKSPKCLGGNLGNLGNFGEFCKGLGLLPSGQNIHRHQPESFNTEYHPDFWVNSLQDLVPIIDSNT